jgi:hypothetical protein
MVVGRIRLTKPNDTLVSLMKRISHIGTEIRSKFT